MLAKTLFAALTATTCLTAAARAGELTRIATVPLGAEVTGLFVEGADLFMNVQHPSGNLESAFAKATIGVIANADFGAGAQPVPTDAAEKAVVRTSLGAYQILFQQGDFDVIGVIEGASGRIRTSNRPDFNAFVKTGADQGYLFTAFEDRPGGMSRVKMTRAADGTWTVDRSDARMLDFSGVRGTWVNCFGTLSPWGTPLTSEELYFDDTADWNNPYYKYISGPEALEQYLGTYPNPYDYGLIVEITDPAGAATPVKRRALGRFSHENAVVMPDQRTVYLSDDGLDTVFFKFVADRAGDLSAGTLFAAKATQMGAPGADAASTPLKLEWIELAHGTDTQIDGWVRDYDGISQDDHGDDSSYLSDADVVAWAEGKATDDRAAFLESRKAAKAKGATAEFRKMEGVNIHYEGARDGSVPYMYMAMSEVTKGMSDSKGDLQLGEARCGVVYQMRLDGAYNVDRMVPVVAGGAFGASDPANACAVDTIANPDNLVVLANGDVVIGEDSGAHENNALWLFRPEN